MTTEYEETYKLNWKSIIEDDNGNIIKDQVMRELHDYSNVMRGAAEVYCHVTGGAVSKVLTKPEVIISLADEHAEEFYETVIAERDKEIEELYNQVYQIKQLIRHSIADNLAHAEECINLGAANSIGHSYYCGAYEELKYLLAEIIEQESSDSDG